MLRPAPSQEAAPRVKLPVIVSIMSQKPSCPWSPTTATFPVCTGSFSDKASTMQPTHFSGILSCPSPAAYHGAGQFPRTSPQKFLRTVFGQVYKSCCYRGFLRHCVRACRIYGFSPYSVYSPYFGIPSIEWIMNLMDDMMIEGRAQHYEEYDEGYFHLIIFMKARLLCSRLILLFIDTDI